jgi:hypothetical protein
MAEGRNTFLVDDNMTDFVEEQGNTNIFSFINFGDNPILGDSSLLNQMDDVLSSEFGSDLSSPDISSPEHPLSPSILLCDPSLESSLAINVMNDGGFNTIPVLDQSNFPMQPEDFKEVKPNATEVDKKSAKKGRGKKRQRHDPNESTDISAVTLTRDQTLCFSSEDFDMFVEEITRVRPLTYAEEKELKRQKRLIKNRESAQASRQRKKSYIDELEAEIKKLKQENTLLSSQVHGLSSENKGLREELQKIQTLLKKTGTTIINTLTPKTLPVQTPSLGSVSPRGPTQKAKAGVCLLILLFSFGLFFNVERGPVKSVSPAGNAIARIVERSPAMAAGPAKLFFNGNEGGGNGRRLLETQLSPDGGPREEYPARIEQPAFETSNGKGHSHKITINERSQRPDYKQSVTTASSYYEEVHRTRDKEAHLGVNFMEFMNESINSNVSEMEDVEVRKWFTDRLRVRPNTAFFSVSDFQQIIPPNMQPFDSNAPFFVSLLVPASSFTNQLSDGSVVDNSMIEVTAQVVNVNHTTLNLDEVNRIRQIPIVA